MVASVVFGLLSTALDRSVTASEDSTVRTGAEPASAASSTVEPAVEELSTPEPSASARIGVRLDGELFAGWRWSEPRGVGDATNAFEIDRAELGVRFELPRNFGLEVRVESGRPPELSGDVLGGSPLYLFASGAPPVRGGIAAMYTSSTFVSG
jgi:hypothetical protein